MKPSAKPKLKPVELCCTVQVFTRKWKSNAHWSNWRRWFHVEYIGASSWPPWKTWRVFSQEAWAGTFPSSDAEHSSLLTEVVTKPIQSLPISQITGSKAFLKLTLKRKPTNYLTEASLLTLPALFISEPLSFSSVSSFDFLVFRLLKLKALESPEVADLVEALELLLSDAWDMIEFLLDVDWLSDPKLSLLSLRVARLLNIPMLFLLRQPSKTEIISLPPMTQPSS